MQTIARALSGPNFEFVAAFAVVLVLACAELQDGIPAVLIAALP